MTKFFLLSLYSNSLKFKVVSLGAKIGMTYANYFILFFLVTECNLFPFLEKSKASFYLDRFSEPLYGACFLHTP